MNTRLIAVIALASLPFNVHATKKKDLQQDENPALLKQRTQVEALELENTLKKAELEKELIDTQAQIQRLVLEKEKLKLQEDIEYEKNMKAHAKKVLALHCEKEKIQAEIDLAKAKVEQSMGKFLLRSTELANKVNMLRGETERIEAEIAHINSKAVREDHLNGTPVYLKNPLRKDGILVLSDRCIELNNTITPLTADRVADQIHYLDNKNSKHPIFLVIDSSPGGSVMAGFKILQTMKDSTAPVYVVVKSFAASMAACIATLAERSYVYPNATILHHQPWRCSRGNLRKQQENNKELQEVWKRLGRKIAKKMGISLTALNKKLYDKSANGDWKEFGDNAKTIKWIDHVIQGVKETGLRQRPNPDDYTLLAQLRKLFGSEAKSQENTLGNSTMHLPILGPQDFYYMYSPSNELQ